MKNRIMPKRAQIMLIIMLLVVLSCLPADDTMPMKARDYPLGDIPLDKATLEKYFRDQAKSIDGLASRYDARSDGIVSTSKNQGRCGSCWAFACVGALEAHIKKTFPSTSLFDLSEQQLVSCDTGQSACSGGNSSAILFWENKGPNLEVDYPYASGGGSVPACMPDYTQLAYRVKNFTCTSGTENYKASLYEKGPSYWRYNVHSDFQDYWDGSETKAYKNTVKDIQGGHAVLIIGWDDDKEVVGGGKGAFLCKNSWGASGGPNGDGTFWIAYSGHANNLGFSMCNFDVESGVPGTLLLTSPNGGENWRKGEIQTITWTATGLSGNLSIELLIDNVLVGLIAQVPVSSGSYLWQVGTWQGGVVSAGTGYKIRLRQ